MRRIGIMDLKTVPEFKVLRLHVRIQSFSKVSRKMQFLYQFNHIRVVAQPDDRCPCREFCFNQSIQSEARKPINLHRHISRVGVDNRIWFSVIWKIAGEVEVDQHSVAGVTNLRSFLATDPSC
jgi:hypothetical protein